MAGPLQPIVRRALTLRLRKMSAPQAPLGRKKRQGVSLPFPGSEAAYLAVDAKSCQVSTTESGFREIELMPSSRSH